MEKSKPTGYSLTKDWFDFVLDNPDKVSGNHTALYLWIVEINNRNGWREKFGITVREGMDGMSCKHRNTYSKCFKDLIEWGFIKVIVPAVNQYQCNIIAITKNVQANSQATDKHIGKQEVSTDTSIDTIQKQLNNETIKQDNIEKSVSSLIDENLSKKIQDYFGFNEIANFDKIRQIADFLRCLDIGGKTETFRQQFEAYIEFKKINNSYTHSFKNFLGTQDVFYMNGAWNAENWTNKLSIEKLRISKNGKSKHKTTVGVGNKINGRDDFGKL